MKETRVDIARDKREKEDRSRGKGNATFLKQKQRGRVQRVRFVSTRKSGDRRFRSEVESVAGQQGG